MYKEHKALLWIVFFIVAIITFIFDLHYSEIASDAINVVAIASAVYLAVYAGIQSSETLFNRLKNEPDRRLPGKSELGVINTYIKYSLTIGFITMIISIIVILLHTRFNESIDVDTHNLVSFIKALSATKIEPSPIVIYAQRALSSLGMGTFAMSFVLMWEVGKFIVNRIAFSR